MTASVPGVGKARRDCTQGPRRHGPVRVASRVRRGRARHPCIIQRPGDPGGAAPGQPLREHPRHHRRCHRVRLKAMPPPPPGRVRLVRVRPGVRDPPPAPPPPPPTTPLPPPPRLHPTPTPPPPPPN